MRSLGRAFLALGVAAAAAYAGFLVYIDSIMRRPPEEFARRIAKMPGPAFLVLPFETLWTRARSGPLQIGDMAPDFDLETVNKTGRVRLSAFRGVRPVVLIFGSYT
jgi:hypothetical protein